MSVRPSTFLEVNVWCRTVNFFPEVKFKVTGLPSLSNLSNVAPTLDWWIPTWSTKANGGFHYYESLEPFPGRNGAGIFYPNRGARPRDTELRRNQQNVEHVKRRWPSVPHETNFLLTFHGSRFVHGFLTSLVSEFRCGFLVERMTSCQVAGHTESFTMLGAATVGVGRHATYTSRRVPHVHRIYQPKESDGTLKYFHPKSVMDSKFAMSSMVWTPNLLSLCPNMWVSLDNWSICTKDEHYFIYSLFTTCK